MATKELALDNLVSEPILILLALILSCAMCPACVAGQTLEELEHLDKEKIEAAAWVPGDAGPMQKIEGKDFRVVAYQYRIEFFRGAATKPSKTLTFKHPFLTFVDKNILVCTNRFQEYSAQDDHEKRMILLRGGRDNGLAWTNEHGFYDQFCGVIAPDASIVFQFPPEEFPQRIYFPIGIARDGKAAAVLVATYGKIEHPEDESDDAEGDDGFNYKQLWVWEFPKSIRKKPINRKEMNGNLLQDLRSGKL